MAKDFGTYGDFFFVPVAMGFTFGAFFVWGIIRMGSRHLLTNYDVADGGHSVHSDQVGA